MAHGGEKPKTKRPYTKVRMVPEDSKMKDHGFNYYAEANVKTVQQNVPAPPQTLNYFQILSINSKITTSYHTFHLLHLLW